MNLALYYFLPYVIAVVLAIIVGIVVVKQLKGRIPNLWLWFFTAVTVAIAFIGIWQLGHGILLAIAMRNITNAVDLRQLMP